MSNQFENENQQTIAPEEVRQSLLAELEEGKQAIAELSDEDLEEIAGGRFGSFLGKEIAGGAVSFAVWTGLSSFFG